MEFCHGTCILRPFSMRVAREELADVLDSVTDQQKEISTLSKELQKSRPSNLKIDMSFCSLEYKCPFE